MIEHITTSGHRVWIRIYRPQNLQTYELIFKIQVAWCMREVNSSVVCNQQVGSRQHRHEEVTLQCSPPTLHHLMHCHWTTWMCCLAWSWLFYLHQTKLWPGYSLVGWSGVKILIEVDIDGVNWSEYQSWCAALTLSRLVPLCSAVLAATFGSTLPM